MKWILVCWIWVVGAVGLVGADAPYNVLLFMADDLHAGSLQTYGSKVPDLTPNLDRFAKSGMTFMKAHVNVAICSPCRKVIGTGLYGHNSGAFGFDYAKPGTPHVIDVMRRGGYRTGILGKQAHSTPVKGATWDYAFDQRELGNGRSPSRYYEHATIFLGDSKKAGKPFYFMVNAHDPHRPYCNPKALTRGAEMPSKIYQPQDVEVPGFVPDLPQVRQELAQYQNSTRRLDDVFGKVMQALDESGMADRTLVVFLTDNGIAIPFAKCNAYFHATRTPFLFRLPGVVQPGRTDTQHFVSTIDLLPTFLELTGVKGPARLDGRSMLSLLKGGTQPDRNSVFTQIDTKAGGSAVPMRAVQNEKFGYIFNPFSLSSKWYRNNNEGLTMKAMVEAAKTDPAIAKRVDLFRYRTLEEFYDLERDPNCLNNLADNPEYQGELKRMQAKLVAYMRDSSDPMLAAYENKGSREKVDAVILNTYGKLPGDKLPGQKTAKNKKGKKKTKK